MVPSPLWDPPPQIFPHPRRLVESHLVDAFGLRVAARQAQAARHRGVAAADHERLGIHRLRLVHRQVFLSPRRGGGGVPEGEAGRPGAPFEGRGRRSAGGGFVVWTQLILASLQCMKKAS